MPIWLLDLLKMIVNIFSLAAIGSYREKAKNAGKALNAARKAKRIRDRVVIDDAYRERIRKLRDLE